jgi:VCBS repeat-containing protein
VNFVPNVGADLVVVSKDSGPVSGNVLANDVDPDGDTLVVFNPGTYTRDRGELIINADGTYTFTVNVSHPDIAALQSGQGWLLEFTLTITDGRDFVITTMRVEIWGFDDP